MDYADLMIYSDAIFTGLGKEPFKGCVAISGNRILAAGDQEELKQYEGPDTKVFHYGENLVMPGFIDCHMHLMSAAMFRSNHYLDLAGTASEADCLERLEKHLMEHPELDHVTGWGWCMNDWDSRVYPTKASLDAVTSDIPVYIFYNDGNSMWLNSSALKASGMTKDKKPKFGSYEKDKYGELTGIVFGCHGHSLDLAFTVSDNEWLPVKKQIFQNLAEFGITSVGDMAGNTILTGETWLYERLREAEKSGELTARVHLYPSLDDNGNFESAKMVRSKYNSDFLRFSGLKQFIDGTTAFHTSLLLEPYSDKPDVIGTTHYPPEFFMDHVPAANKEGFSVRLHAIGDACVRIALNSMEKSAAENDITGITNCIEHAENIHPDDLARFGRIGAIASMQPGHLILDNNEKTERIGKTRARYEWPLRSLLDAGARLAFSTDHPVYDLNPMLEIHAAVTRCAPDGKAVGSSPEEVITLAEALAAYTVGSAYSLNRENDLGTLEPGKLADLVVMDGNLFTLDKQELHRAKSILTIMDGKIIYQA